MTILIIALSGIGDALMFTPALRLLRERHPDAVIDLLAMFAPVADLFRNNRDVNNVLHWDFLKRRPVESIRFVLADLRPRKYDLSISVYPQNRWEYNLIGFLIGARQRAGHRYDHVSRRGLDFLNTISLREQEGLHNVEENVRLVRNAGVEESGEIPNLQIHIQDDEHRRANQWRESQGISSAATLVGFHAGSALFKNQARRRWSPEKYAALGVRLIEESSARILLFGGPEEYPLNEKISGLMGGRGMVVRTSTMRETAAIMQLCMGFVSNDSSLMHVASALGLPVVAVFAFTSPARVHPWKTRHIIVRRELECSPCFYYSPRPARCKWPTDKFRCIEMIGVDEVLAAARNLFIPSKTSQ